LRIFLSFKFGDDSHLDINGTNLFSYVRKLQGKEQRPDNAGGTTHNKCAGGADPGRQRTCEEVTNWRHADNGRRINAHHTTTLILFHDALQNCVSRCYLHNHPESGKKHHGQRNYENVGKGKGDDPHTENDGSICNESPQPQNRLSRREIDGACEGADTRGRHEKSQRVRSAVENIFRKNGHEDSV